MLHKNLLSAIGNTPLVKIGFSSPTNIFAKLEYLNPGGSVKDRSALYMIEEAERNGIVKPGGTLIEASSGNQGIATALIGAIKGYKVIITVFEKISEEKYKTIRAYGAQVVKCPGTQFVDDPLSYHSQAVAIHKSTPNSFMLNQYLNPSNATAHYAMLGPEIWKQTEGKITHFFAASGTCGTISGAGKYLKEQNPAIKVIGIDAATSFRATNGQPQPYKLEGIGVDFDTPLLDKSIIDEFLLVTDDDAISALKSMASQHGFLIGPSSGAAAAAVEKYACTMGPNDLGVVIFGDSGRAYLTKGFYDTVETQVKPAHKSDKPTYSEVSL